MRWALLRQILGDMRAKMAEMSSNISEGQHQRVVLEQHLVRERSLREAIQGTLKNELVELKEHLTVEIHKLRQESKKGLDEATSALQQQVQTLVQEQSDALKSQDALAGRGWAGCRTQCIFRLKKGRTPPTPPPQQQQLQQQRRRRRRRQRRQQQKQTQTQTEAQTQTQP